MALANRGMCYIQLEEYQKAEQDCSASIKIDPKYVKSYFRRGLARKHLNKLEEAIDDFQDVLTLEPGNKQAIEELREISKIKESRKRQQEEKLIEKVEEKNIEKKPKKIEEKKVKQKLNKVEETKIEKKSEKTTQLLVNAKEMKEEKMEQKIGSNKNRSNSTASILNISIPLELPKTPPKTSYEFEAFWNSAKYDQKIKYAYIKLIPPESFPSLFKNSLTIEIFQEIIQILNDNFLQ